MIIFQVESCLNNLLITCSYITSQANCEKNTIITTGVQCILGKVIGLKLLNPLYLSFSFTKQIFEGLA